MANAPIYFRFPDDASARMALSTLGELGYHAHPTAGSAGPVLEIFVEFGDLTSALEISQAYGGEWFEPSPEEREDEVYRTAYMTDEIPIPAHVVNEDWADGYAEGNDSEADKYTPVDSGDEEGVFDPSGDDYNHFSPGVRV